VLRGIKLDAAHNYVGNFFDLLNPYSLLGGLATLTLFTLDGALFLALKTTGEIRQQANLTARRAGLLAILAGGGFLAWTELSYRAPGHGATGATSVLLAALAAVGLVMAFGANRLGREGAAFAAAAAGIAAATAALFTALYPNVLPSTISAAYNLTTGNAASTAKTLALMTVIACIFLPLVLAYQGWTYWVFRKRIGAAPQPPQAPPTGQAQQPEPASR
jgi:cytochrome d ubiquinol oxidase subunit II